MKSGWEEGPQLKAACLLLCTIGGPPKLGFLKQILELANQKRSYVEKKGWEGSKVSRTVGIGR